MAEEHFSNVSDAIHSLFDTKHFEPNAKRRATISLSVKKQFLQHYLVQHWEEICGKNLAKRCSLDRIERKIIYVNTQNASMASELFMMKDLFLKKVNALLDDEMTVVDARFHTGKLHAHSRVEHEAVQENIEYTTCPRCGASMPKGWRTCGSCQRELQEETEQKILEMLRLQPWLQYKECNQYIPCDEALFHYVKDKVKQYYFELVIANQANELQTQKAVMLLKELPPYEITEDIYKKAMDEFQYYRKRRKADQTKWEENHVSTSRSGLYGKK